MSTLEDGRMIISGGSDAAAVSIYDPASNVFTKGPNMKVARGYQTSVTTSEGKIFELGGSYSGGFGGKIGELYDPVTNSWTALPNAKTDPILTTDNEGIWRTDNVGSYALATVAILTLTACMAICVEEWERFSSWTK